MSGIITKIFKLMEAANSQFTWALILVVGIFCLFIDYKVLLKKKLKREAKLCNIIGWIYIVFGIGIFVMINIFG